MSSSNNKQQEGDRPQREGSRKGLSHPITGKAYAEKVTQAFDAKKLTKDPVSAFKSFQSIMIEHARLMSWL